MIYVATSWRNSYQQTVVEELYRENFDVYDFHNPEPGNKGFHWSEIDEYWKDWDLGAYREALEHPIARKGYGLDIDAMNASNGLVLIMPCGRSAHLEAGIAIGQNKPTAIYFPEGDVVEPELMYAAAGCITDDLFEVIEWFKALNLLDDPERVAAKAGKKRREAK